MNVPTWLWQTLGDAVQAIKASSSSSEEKAQALTEASLSSFEGPARKKHNVVTYYVLITVMLVCAPSLAIRSSLFLMWTLMSALLASLQGVYVVYQLVMILVSLVMLSALLAIRRAYSMLQVMTRATPKWQRLYGLLSQARSYSEFEELAEELALNEDWVNDETDAPCATLLRRAISDLKVRDEKDTDLESLRFTLSGLTKRNHLGIEAARWYPPCNPTRTKKVIDEYLESVCDALKEVASCESIKTDEKAAFFSRLKRTVGVTALSLSGGGSITMYHGGHLLGLIEAGVYDQIKVVSGTSGGAIMAAMMGCKTKEEMLKDVLVDNVATDYTRDGEQKRRNLRFFPPLWKQMMNFARTRVLVDSLIFKETCDFYWGDVTFQEAHEKTGKVLCISVSAQRADGQADSVQRLLMNHITTPHVTLASAVAASCALPGILRPQRLGAKDRHGNVAPFEVDGVSWIDGSIQADVPFKRMATLFNVSNFIVCQVNFHVRLVVEDSSSMAALESTAGPEGNRRRNENDIDEHTNFPLFASFFRGSTIKRTKTIAQNVEVIQKNTFHNAYRRLVGAAELSMRMRATMLSQLGLMPSLYGNNLRKVFSQKYHGDVTITPKFTYMQSIGISAIIQPDRQDMRQYLLGGKRAVYPHANRIRHMLMLETTLLDCVHQTRTERRKAAYDSFLTNNNTLDNNTSLSDDEGVFYEKAAVSTQQKKSSSNLSLKSLSAQQQTNNKPRTTDSNKQTSTHYRQLEWEYRRLQTRFERLRSENLDLRRRLEDIRSMCAPDSPETHSSTTTL